MSDSIPFIHAGLHKTGTTYLQDHIFPSIKGITYIGKSVQALSLYGVLGKHITTLAIRASRCTESRTTSLVPLIETIKASLCKINSHERRRLVYSNESLLQTFELWAPDEFNPRDEALIPLVILQNHGVIGPETKILAVKRNLPEFVVSLYFEVVLKRYTSKLPFLTMREWLSLVLDIHSHNKYTFLWHYLDPKSKSAFLDAPEGLGYVEYQDFYSDLLYSLRSFISPYETGIDTDILRILQLVKSNQTTDKPYLISCIQANRWEDMGSGIRQANMLLEARFN